MTSTHKQQLIVASTIFAILWTILCWLTAYTIFESPTPEWTWVPILFHFLLAVIATFGSFILAQEITP